MTASYHDIDGKSVLVTGGASGIGASIVRAFCAQGAHVGFFDIDDDAAAKLIDQIRDQYGVAPVYSRLICASNQPSRLRFGKSRR